MDVTQAKTNQRILPYHKSFYVEGRLSVHRITTKEAMFKVCKVKKIKISLNGVQYLYTCDERAIRYSHPKLDITTSTIIVDSGNLCMINGGRKA